MKDDYVRIWDYVIVVHLRILWRIYLMLGGDFVNISSC
jgi:hypothetical protein